MMINPIAPAVEVWFVIWNNLPSAVLAFANFCLGFFLILCLFKLIYHLRG